MTFFTSYNYEGAATRIMNKLVSTFKPCGKDKDTGTHFITQTKHSGCFWSPYNDPLSLFEEII